MPHERFYSFGELQIGGSVVLSGTEHHHLRVLRLREGEEVEVVNGVGDLGVAKVTEILKEASSLKVISLEKKEPLTPRITLAIPLMRASKLEWVIEKGTEIGADAFIIYKAEYSENETLSPNKIERLRNLTISALKQSGRAYLPSLEFLPSLAESLRGDSKIFYGDPRATQPLAPTQENIQFVTGPEKGFSKEELTLLEKHGNPSLLSPYTLRAETAPLTALSILAISKI